MNPEFIAIYDDEMRYAFRLMEYLHRNRKLPYEVCVFTNEEKLLAWEKDHTAALLIVAEKRYTREVADGGFPAVLVLNESGSYLGESILNVSKYQSMEAIVDYIVDRCLREKEPAAPAVRHGPPMKILGIYTPITRCLQTTFALTIGQILARKAPVLYLNFEQYDGLSNLLGRTFRGGMGDLLYYNECAKERVAGELVAMTEDLGGLHFLPPMHSYIESHAIRADQWISLFRTIESVSDYATLILDLTENVEGLPDVLRVCDRVFMIEREDGISVAKIRQYEELLQWMDYQDVYARTVHLKLPVFKRLPANLHYLTHGELADYCMELLKENELL
ncbi:MAG: hypothetical protein J5935_05520 [Lachnospiraceae bacterium]|nr:hypothetical protein [Lachnospiraceae bacterium]